MRALTIAPLIITLVTLAPLVVDDWRHRRVYLWQLGLFAVAQVVFCLLTLGGAETLGNAAGSLAVLAVLALCVGLYVRFRFKGKRQAIGWGDLLFVVALTPYFEARVFVGFLVVSLSLTLAGWAFLRWRRKAAGDIPLVSAVGLCYIALLCYHLIAGR
ncbi:MAG: hypothetical protein LBN29_08705 [Mediterranea sp.]|jgi:hypothetical protein|nr:hypothetical protein [Mediterranea sp.]